MCRSGYLSRSSDNVLCDVHFLPAFGKCCLTCVTEVRGRIQNFFNGSDYKMLKR